MYALSEKNNNLYGYNITTDIQWLFMNGVLVHGEPNAFNQPAFPRELTCNLFKVVEKVFIGHVLCK